jgi:hypothetical protein
MLSLLPLLNGDCARKLMDRRSLRAPGKGEGRSDGLCDLVSWLSWSNSFFRILAKPPSHILGERAGNAVHNATDVPSMTTRESAELPGPVIWYDV